MMYFHHREVRDAAPSEESGIANPVRERQQQQAIADRCVVPRCPCCRTPLVARLTCTGPHFTCHCDEHRFG
jgi:hypothetical protein